MKKLLNAGHSCDANDDIRRVFIRFCRAISAQVDLLNAEVAVYRQLALKLSEADPALDSTSKFYYALKRGEIIGIPACAARSCDVYECYRIWCARIGERSISMVRFVNVLKCRHRVTNGRWRYFGESNVEHGPHGVLMLGDESFPPGDDRSAWLGERIDRFKTALKDMRGGLFHA